ncbi:MAG: ribokinase [Verrucomicrobia bacterium]|nr:MAG: ribokinase [Verrucomicrobiota bacterium]
MGKTAILVLGSANMDLTVKVPRIPKAGETVLGGGFVSTAGGKGANQAVSAARAGGNVVFIGRVGRDAFGNQTIAGFEAEGIRTNFIFRDRRSASGVALILVGKDGQNQIAVAPGANANLTPSDIKRASTAFRGAAIFLTQLETPLQTAQAGVELACANGIPVILNPAPARALPRRLLSKVWILTPNETEAELLTGIAVKDNSSATRAAEQLLARGAQNVIITLGAKGAFVRGDGVCQLITAHRMKAVDTTAAGDVFNGALAVALAEGKPLIDAARFANAAAAISVGRPGAQASAPTRREIERLLQLRRKFTPYARGIRATGAVCLSCRPRALTRRSNPIWVRSTQK